VTALKHLFLFLGNNFVLCETYVLEPINGIRHNFSHLSIT